MNIEEMNAEDLSTLSWARLTKLRDEFIEYTIKCESDYIKNNPLKPLISYKDPRLCLIMEARKIKRYRCNQRKR
jgi:hypothetical protein